MVLQSSRVCPDLAQIERQNSTIKDAARKKPMIIFTSDKDPNETRGMSLNAFGLALGVFGASVFGIGRFHSEAKAQTMLETSISLTLPLSELRMSAAARAEVETALRAMSDSDLSLTYARIHATFREYVGHDDLSVARALVDYATLAESELGRRNILRPNGTDSSAQMLITYQLVL